MSTVEHPRIRPGVLEDRLYQQRIAETASEHNTLVVLPTGLGKTAIALRVIAEYLQREPTRSVLLLAPTRPLVVQHAASIERSLLAPKPVVLTGTLGPARRASQLRPPQVVVATPQVIANDLAAGQFSLDDFSLLVFDEAHRAVGDYSYGAIGRANLAGPPRRVLAMTASPGSSIDRIREVWANLGISRFEYRTASDADVLPYVHGIGVETVEVPVPPALQEIAIRLRAAVQRQVEWLRNQRFLPEGSVGTRRDLLALGERLRHELDAARRRGDSSANGLWGGVTAQSTAIKELHALELVESQGVEQLRSFLEAQEHPPSGRATPSQRRFLADPDVVRIQETLRSLAVDLPKIEVAHRIVREELERSPSARVILFAQYRETAEALVKALDAPPGSPIRAARFVGQASRGSDEGLSQKEQVAILERFRSGEINCLVATSVAEEGLDVPSTDLVVFYEPVPDVIRTIQRRGRTGRARAGRVVVLVAQGTRDVGLQRSARSRERRMHAMLEEVEREAHSGTMPTPKPVRRQKAITEYD